MTHKSLLFLVSLIISDLSNQTPAENSEKLNQLIGKKLFFISLVDSELFKIAKNIKIFEIGRVVSEL